MPDKLCTLRMAAVPRSSRHKTVEMLNNDYPYTALHKTRPGDIWRSSYFLM